MVGRLVAATQLAAWPSGVGTACGVIVAFCWNHAVAILAHGWLAPRAGLAFAHPQWRRSRGELQGRGAWASGLRRRLSVRVRLLLDSFRTGCGDSVSSCCLTFDVVGRAYSRIRGAFPAALPVDVDFKSEFIALVRPGCRLWPRPHWCQKGNGS